MDRLTTALEQHVRVLQLQILQLQDEISVLPMTPAAANAQLKAQLDLIHAYNRARDDTQKLFGLIAEKTGETVASVYERYQMKFDD
ncbi:hypothetical protein BDR26DRAFT_1010024 [Obelidium mucronatum]|nr:hypothetical protein BDR26DRAFT_1010024 [Obelidium mucronatum]